MYRRSRRRFGYRALATSVGMGAVVFGSVSAVHAAPIDDKRAEAAEVEAEINSSAEQLSVLNEELNGVRVKIEAARGAVDDAERRIGVAKAETKLLVQLVQARAASVYRGSGTGSDLSIFDLDPKGLVTREQYSDAAASRDNALMDQLAAAREDLAALRDDAKKTKAEAEAEQHRLEQKKTEFDRANADRQQLLARVQGELKQLVDEAATQRAAAEAPPAATAGQPFDPGTLPSGSGGAAAAVAYAQAQLGKPYEYAATGPNSFDCSGLTMMAWRQGGVSMPHNDAAQMAAFPHVPMNQLQPGDLVWFPGHIALYVGGGTVIVAPKTGDVVKYQSVGLYQAAARPG